MLMVCRVYVQGIGSYARGTSISQLLEQLDLNSNNKKRGQDGLVVIVSLFGSTTHSPSCLSPQPT